MPAVVVDGKVKYVSDEVSLSDANVHVLATALPENVKYVIKKLIIYNKDTTSHDVSIGEYDTTGASWNETKLTVKVASGEQKVLTERELPADFVMTTDKGAAILAWAAKLDAAPTNPVLIKAEFDLE